MSEVRIRWTQRVAGRHPGDVETLELTPWVEAVIAAGRVEVLEEAPAPEGPAAPEVVEEAPRHRRPKPAPIVGVFDGEATSEAGNGEADPE